MRKIYVVLTLLIAMAVSSCKKSDNGTLTGPSKKGTMLDLIKDSVYLYTKEANLWYDQMPTYTTFKPRNFNNAEDATALTNELNALAKYPINPNTGNPYEATDDGGAKYSFIDDGAVSGELNGTKGDFGFGIQWYDIDDLRVIYVYPGSPAAREGIKRGDKIININGRTNLSYDGPKYGDESSNNLNFVINAYSNSKAINMILDRHDGSTLTINNLATGNYTVNPVLKDTVYNLGAGKKVGYMVFNTFTSVENAGPQLDAAFNKFSGITDLIVDLRYNGGGYVETAEYLDNLIVPPSNSGKLMYTYYYNKQLQNDIHPLLSTQFDIKPGDFKPENNQVPFAKKGSLNLTRVFFIMTGNTASASELTINNLRPHMAVQFIGSQSYGKPVGFFAININKYQLYTPEFSTENSANQGGYYDGFMPGQLPDYPGVKASDDETTDFGDVKEGLLSRALGYIQTGSYISSSTQQVQSLASGRRSFSINDQRTASLKITRNKFVGMIVNKIGNKTLKSKKPVR